MNFKTILKYINYKITACTDHDLHSPFLFRFYSELINNPFPYNDFELLHKIRIELLQSTKTIEFIDFGAGSKKIKLSTRSISQITKYGIAQKKQAEFLYRFINFLNPKTIIEMGTSVGLTTLYLAKAAPKATVYTLEGSNELINFSNSLFQKNNINNINLIAGNFNQTFPQLLNIMEAIDVLYVDGNHAYAPTVSYFEQALQKKHTQSVFIFDDINWSDDMQKAWQYIHLHKEVTLSLDFFFFGIVFFRTEQKQKEHFVIKF